jgi:hypothetical protein
MKLRAQRVTSRLCASIVITALGLAGFFGASASADPGDTFYLVNKEKAFVSFVVRAGSSEASELAFGAKKIPCPGKPRDKTEAMLNNLQASAPIVGGVFRQDWSPFEPDFGYVKGTIDGDSASGVLNLRIGYRSKQDGKTYTCRTGNRKWTARSVSEQQWNAAREKRAGITPG